MTTTTKKTAAERSDAVAAAQDAINKRKAAKERRHLAKVEAETRKLVAEAEEAEARARQYKLEADAAQLDWDQRMASDYHHGIFHFDQAVGEQSVRSMTAALAQHHRRNPQSPIEIVFYSPGGDVFAGMALFDYLQTLRTSGHHVTITCRGYAASMAGILLQAGDVRRMGRESYILIHEISTAARGKVSEIKDEVKFIEKMGDRVIDIFVRRSAESNSPKKLTRAMVRRNWGKTDWWLDSAEALEYGVVDEVA